MRHTIPAFIFSLIRFSLYIQHQQMDLAVYSQLEQEEGAQVTQKRVFKLFTELLALIQSSYPELALRLNLQAVQAINNLKVNTDLEEMCYEFMSTAFQIFEEDISETDQKVQALNLLTTTLYTLTCFGPDNFDTLCTNCISYSGKLLKKPLQAEANTTSAHLWNTQFRKNGQKVMDQLRKSIKMSEAVIGSKPENLFLLV